MKYWRTYIQFWQQSFNFKGRATRREYWIPQLFHIIILLMINIIALIIFSIPAVKVPYLVPALYIISLLFIMIVLVPRLAVMCRRFHDAGQSGWWALLYVVSPVSWNIVIRFTSLLTNDNLSMTLFLIVSAAFILLQIWSLVQLCSESQQWQNKWGEYVVEKQTS